jgi:hypothetical protein
LKDKTAARKTANPYHLSDAIKTPSSCTVGVFVLRCKTGALKSVESKLLHFS